MSVQTWLDEFMPTSANSPEAKADPLTHSLRKWEGLQPENLTKHEVEVFKAGNCLIPIRTPEKQWWEEEEEEIENTNLTVVLGSERCALCHCYLDMDDKLNSCRACPIFQHNKINCGDAYRWYKAFGNIKPMLTLLQITKNHMEEEAQLADIGGEG